MLPQDAERSKKRDLTPLSVPEGVSLKTHGHCPSIEFTLRRNSIWYDSENFRRFCEECSVNTVGACFQTQVE